MSSADAGGMMRALELGESIGPSGLRASSVPVPSGEGVLVEVRAAGVGYPDLLLTEGKYQLAAEPPFVPGFEVAGTVRRAPASSGLEPGQAVFGTAILGGFAEFALLDPPLVSLLPAAVDFATGAALVSNYATAYFALGLRSRLDSGETLAVLGAAGGLGGASIAVGKALGARVIAVARREGVESYLRGIGADEVVPATSGWSEAIHELTDRGADVVIDPVGGDGFDEGVRALGPGGRIVVTGFVSGSIPEVKVNRVLFRNVDVVGAAWGEWLGREPAAWRQVSGALTELIDASSLAMPAVTRYPLEEGARALLDLESGDILGKAVLTTTEG